MHWLYSLRSKWFGSPASKRLRHGKRQQRLQVRSLEDRVVPSVAMVTDLNSYTNSSNPSNLTNVNGTCFFTAQTNTGEAELFASNGTAGGTTQLTFNGHPSNIANLVAFNNKLFFTAYSDNTSAYALFTSDGTVAGTQPFVANGANVPVSYYQPTSYAVVGSKLYFEALDTSNGYDDLWVSDGTSAGTHPVQPGSTTTANYYLDQFTAVGSKLFFEGYDTVTGNHTLWVSNGTAAGTNMVTELAGGNSITTPVALGSKLTFQMYDSANSSYALWQTDGTTTTKVADLGANGGGYSSPTVLGTKLYFQVYDPANATLTNYDLWSYDGTHAPAVFKYGGGTTATNVANNTPMAVMGGNLYFNAYDNTNSWTLWKTDGSSTGTTGTVQTTGSAPFNYYPTELAVNGTSLYFVAQNSADQNRYDLWKTNGTSGGTVPVQSSGYGYNISYLTAVGSKVFFQAEDLDANNQSPHGYELWASDGTNGGTGMVTDISTYTGGSNPYNLTAVGNEIFFTANGYNPLGTYLWQSDGSAANTSPVQTSTGTLPTSVQNIIAVGSTLFFTAYGPNNGYDLWTSGTGTKSAVELFPTAGTNPFSNNFDSSDATAFVNLGGTLYFGAYDAANSQYALWKSDGTAAGTKVVQDLGQYQMYQLTGAGTTLFWEQYDPATGIYALWKFNGTTASQVADINNGGNGDFNKLTAVGSQLFCEAYDYNTSQYALWTSNGTAAGTIKLMEFGTGNQLYDLTSFNGELYFAAVNPTAGQWQLWTSTGTVAGTTQFLNSASQPIDVWTGTGANFLVAGSLMYFDELDLGNSYGVPMLAKTDGTAAGTVEVQAGSNSTIARNATYLAYVNGTVVFNAYDNTHNYELWQSDGTAAGTLLTADINPGPSDSSPLYLTTAGNQVFFSAYTPTSGYELWSVAPSPTVVTAGLSGPTDGVIMQQRPFVLTASDSNTGNNSAGFSFAINWGDGTTQTTTGPSGLGVSHQYTSTGDFTVSVTATNLADGVSSVAVTQVDSIAQTEVQGGNMVVGGVPGNDAIVVSKGNKTTNYTISYNGSIVLKDFVPVTGEEIFLYGGNGTNTISVQGNEQSAEGSLTYTTKDTITLGTGYVIFAKATLVPQVPVSWTITGNKAATSGNIFNIQGALTANVTGSTGPDTINILNGTSLTGGIAGGGGVDTLTYAKYSKPVVVNLLQGSATAISGAVSGIRNVTGSSVGGDILVGDANANVLMANKGHNILIGGSGGGDTLTSGGADILIAGTTSYDTNLTALQAILNVWKTATSTNYGSVIQTLEGLTSPQFAYPLVTHAANSSNNTVFDSGATDAADILNAHGATDVDWFFANTGGGGTVDTVNTLNGPNDTTTDI